MMSVPNKKPEGGPTATLILDSQEYTLPVIAGTTGDRVIDISNLRQLTGGVTTFDPAFANTASCRSAISWIDGEEGVLTYRGLPIETLAKERVSFVETAWLLIFGHLPTEAQRDDFRNRLTEYSALHRSMNLHFNAFPPNGHPMAIMSSMINAMSTHDRPRITDEESFTDAAAKLMSKVRTIAAASYKASIGEPAIYPRYDLKYVENFMHMMFSLPYRAYEPDPVAARALNLFFVLHADHGQNCSTSTVRMVGSSGANLFTSCSAGVCALWGDRHGGANVNAVLALQRIRNSGLTPRQYLAKAKDSGRGFLASGIASTAIGTPERESSAVSSVRCSTPCTNRIRCSTLPWSWRKLCWPTTTSSSAGCTPTWTSIPGSFYARSASR